MPKKVQRTNYVVDIPRLKEYAAKMAGNGIFTSGHPGAVEMIKDVMYAKKGADRRELTLEECSNLIRQGGFS